MSNQDQQHHQQQGSPGSSAGQISNGLQAAMGELDELDQLFGLVNERLNAALQLAAKEIQDSHQDNAESVMQGLTQMVEEVEAFANQVQKIRESATNYVGQVV